MRSIFTTYLLWLTMSFVVVSCGRDEFESKRTGKPVKNAIWTLGASRVEGDPPAFYSYRYDLWKRLLDSQWTFDFVGTQTDEFDYPRYLDKAFDSDHQGHSGWTSEDILSHASDWLNLIDTPDIVLLSSPGGNDILEGWAVKNAVTNIEKLLQKIQSYNPEVVVLIEQMAPAKSSFMTDNINSSIQSMHDEVNRLCLEYTTARSLVEPIDMADGFKDEFLADDIHYNQKGAIFIADRYFQELTQYLKR